MKFYNPAEVVLSFSKSRVDNEDDFVDQGFCFRASSFEIVVGSVSQRLDVAISEAFPKRVKMSIELLYTFLHVLLGSWSVGGAILFVPFQINLRG